MKTPNVAVIIILWGAFLTFLSIAVIAASRQRGGGFVLKDTRPIAVTSSQIRAMWESIEGTTL